jgi:hypothetical protein
MCRQADDFKQSKMGRKTLVALSLLCALVEIEAAVQ